MNDKTKKGLLFALIAATISGFSIFYNKFIIIKGIDPQIFNVIKNGGVAVLLTSLILFTIRSKNDFKVSPSTLIKLLAIGIFGGSVPFILYFDGLKTVPAINANIIQKTMFIWVAILALPVLKERINKWQIFGFVLVAWSNLFIGGFSGFSGNRGEIMIFAATLFWSLENILVKLTATHIDSTIAAWARMTIGVILIFGYVFLQGKLSLFTTLSISQILPIAPSIVLLTGYVTTWYKALQYAPATAVASVLILATPITNVLSAIFITHSWPIQQTGNLIGSLFGVVLITILTSNISQIQKNKAT